MTISFRVFGKPKPAGSKVGIRDRKTGRVFMKEAVDSKPWRDSVTAAAMEEYQGPLLEGPLAVSINFYFTRPKGHFGTGKNVGKLKPSARLYPSVWPDLDKLIRNTWDGISGVIWRDDSQIVTDSGTKRYAIGNTREGAEVRIETIDAADCPVMPENPGDLSAGRGD